MVPRCRLVLSKRLQCKRLLRNCSLRKQLLRKHLLRKHLLRKQQLRNRQLRNRQPVMHALLLSTWRYFMQSLLLLPLLLHSTLMRLCLFRPHPVSKVARTISSHPTTANRLSRRNSLHAKLRPDVPRGATSFLRLSANSVSPILSASPCWHPMSLQTTARPTAPAE